MDAGCTPCALWPAGAAGISGDHWELLLCGWLDILFGKYDCVCCW